MQLPNSAKARQVKREPIKIKLVKYGHQEMEYIAYVKPKDEV